MQIMALSYLFFRCTQAQLRCGTRLCEIPSIQSQSLPMGYPKVQQTDSDKTQPQEVRGPESQAEPAQLWLSVTDIRDQSH